MGLTFDADACYRALVDRLIDTMNQVMDTFYKEAISGLSAEGKSATEVEKAHISNETMYKGDLRLGDAKEFIVTKAKFYADAIVESYGTGSKADTGPRSYWNEYTQSDRFNPSRPGKPIVGRPAGNYTDIWGRPRKSNGNLEGIEIEDYYFSGSGLIKSIDPTYSIQHAEDWVIKNGETRVERYIETAVNDFFANEAKNFFVFV